MNHTDCHDTATLTYSESERGYLLYLAEKLGRESAAERAKMTPPPSITMSDAESLARHAHVSTRAKIISPDLWGDLLVAYGTITREQVDAARARRGV